VLLAKDSAEDTDNDDDGPDKRNIAIRRVNGYI